MTATRQDTPSPSAARPPRILLVEDIALVRTVYALVLRRAGYEVAEASNGLEALRVLEDHMPDPDLLVTDFQMPGMDGVELALKVRELRPGLPVLLVSGSPEYIESAEQLLPFATRLPKPASAHDLAATVAQVLGSGQSQPSA